MRGFFYVACEVGDAYKKAVIGCDIKKLEVFGVEYLFELTTQIVKEEVYKRYIAECLCNEVDILCGFAMVEFKMPRYADLFNPKPPEKEESSDEIIARIKSKLKGKEGEN